MDIEELRRQINNVIDEWAGAKLSSEAIPPKKETPKDKRVVRTKSSGDRVYLLDEVKKTRQWINSSNPNVPSPELVEKLGFSMEDVQEIEDSELFTYNMGPVIYSLDE